MPPINEKERKKEMKRKNNLSKTHQQLRINGQLTAE
jgi:hypothetical protein